MLKSKWLTETKLKAPYLNKAFLEEKINVLKILEKVKGERDKVCWKSQSVWRIKQ